MNHPGIVRKIGWEKDVDGNDVFRAVIEFPAAPPDVPMSCVWNQTPIMLVVAEAEEIEP